MNNVRALGQLVLLLVLSFGACGQPATSSASRGIALVGGSLIDGTPGTVARNSVVLVRGERIEAVGTLGSLSIPPGYERISTEGRRTTAPSSAASTRTSSSCAAATLCVTSMYCESPS